MQVLVEKKFYVPLKSDFSYGVAPYKKRMSLSAPFPFYSCDEQYQRLVSAIISPKLFHGDIDLYSFKASEGTYNVTFSILLSNTSPSV